MDIRELQKTFIGAVILDVTRSERDESLCEFKILPSGRDEGAVEYVTIHVSDIMDCWLSKRNFLGHYYDVQEMFKAAWEHTDRCEEWHDDEGEGDDFYNEFTIETDPLALAIEFKCPCGQKFGVALAAIKQSEYRDYFKPENRWKIAKHLSGYISCPEDLERYND